MSGHADIQRRVDALRADAARLDPHACAGEAERVLSEVEHVLAEGYARALAAEARSHRLQKRLESLLPQIDKAKVAEEVRVLAQQRRTLDEGITELRAQLAAIRDEFVMRGEGRAPS